MDASPPPVAGGWPLGKVFLNRALARLSTKESRDAEGGAPQCRGAATRVGAHVASR